MKSKHAKWSVIQLLTIIMVVAAGSAFAAGEALLHNSQTTGSTKWGGNWGVSGGQYGQFTCTTCHATTTSNVKRVIGSIPATIGANVVKPVIFNNMTGFGNDSASHTTSVRICEVCHTLTTSHQYNSNNTPQSGSLSHANGDCTECHSHSNGFKKSVHAVPLFATTAGHTGCASGIGCHANSNPAALFPAVPTGSAPDCRACHAKADPTVATNGCGSCHGAANGNGEPTGTVHPDAAGSHPVHTALTTCTNCHDVGGTGGNANHGKGNKGANPAVVNLAASYTWNGSTCATATSCHPNVYGSGSATTPVWGSTNNGCAACHTVTIATTGPATGSHVAHNKTDCSLCHTGATDYITKPSANHADGDIDVNSGYPATAKHAAGTYAANAKCSTASCHNDPYSSGKVLTPQWGSINNGCSACHSAYPIGANGPATGSHTGHAGKACTSCHAAGTTATAKPITGHNTGYINISGVGYTTNVTKHAAGNGYSQCSNIYCHSDGTKSSAYTSKSAAPDWGAIGAMNCASCHGSILGSGAFKTLSTGRHSKHMANATNLYRYSCETCHAATVTGNSSITGAGNHVNKLINVSFSGIATTGAAGSSYDNNNHAPGATMAADQTCRNIYCHSNAQIGGQAGTQYLFRNLTGVKRFGQTTSVSLGCSNCHTSSSTIAGAYTLSGSHRAHINLTYNAQIGKVLGCTDCHANGGTSLSRANHANGLINYSAALSGSIARGNLKLSTGRCNTVYCHSNGQGSFNNMSANNWFSGVNLGCNGCHGDTTTLTSLSGKHDAHINKVATGGNYGCIDCHATTVINNTTLTATGKHVNAFKDFTGAKAYKTGFIPGSGNCTTYCHTDGKGGAAKSAFTWTGAAIDCKGCHGGGTSRAGEPVYTTGNSHVKHVGTSNENTTCQYCHADTMNGAALNAGGKHIDKFINVTSGNGKTFGYTSGNKTCSNISCHSGGLFASADIQWGASMPADCTGCHANDVSAAALSGAHNAHINNASAGGSFNCRDCHAPTITDVNNRTIANANNHGNSVVNYSGAKAGKNKNCSNIYCHSNGKGASAVIPAWVGGSADCQSCHATANLSGAYAHTPHLAKTGITCASCHSATTTDNATIAAGTTHIDGTVSLQQGGFYPAIPGTKGVSFSSAGTTCNNVSCHSPALAGPYSNTATWGVKANCGTCHPQANLSGAHQIHMGALDLTSAGIYYNMTANRTLVGNDLLGTKHGFGCAECHPMNAANHLNGSIDVDLNRVNVAGVGTLRFLNHSSAGYDISATKKCSNMYCHSNASRIEKESNVRANTSLGWYDKFDNYTGYRGSDPELVKKKDRCAWCHGNQPTTGAHEAHAISNHSNNIYNGKFGKVGFSSTGNSAHGNKDTTTTITCYICHAATVDATKHGNDKNDKCNSCHGVTAPKKGNAYINNLANHVNGQREISFAPIKVRSKAQVRPESFKYYSGVWKRSYYKNMTTLAFDESKLALDTATMWHPSTPKLSNCSNLACHNGYPAVWNMENNQDPNKCMDCHFKL